MVIPDRVVPHRSSRDGGAEIVLSLARVGAAVSGRRPGVVRPTREPWVRAWIPVVLVQVEQAACGSGGIGGIGLAAAVCPSITAGGVAASWMLLSCVLTSSLTDP